MTDVFKDLPRLSWRGIVVPVSERKVSFEQELAIHKYAYRDDELLESLGRKNWRFDYTIPFREDIRKGPYENLYVATFSSFLQACRDRSVGVLEDPMLGEYNARCATVSVQTDVNRRDGEDLQVSFIHSPDLDEQEATGAVASGLPGAVQTGYRLGDEVAQSVDLFPAQLPTISAAEQKALMAKGFEEYQASLNALDQVMSFGSQLSANIDRVGAAISQYEHKVNKMTDLLSDLDQKLLSPENAPVIRGLRGLADSLGRLKDQAGSRLQRQVLTTVLLEEMSLASAASFLSNSMSDLMDLNKGIDKLSIPRNTIVRYYAQIEGL